MAVTSIYLLFESGGSQTFPHVPLIFLAASVYHLQFPETLLCFITHAQALFHVSLENEFTLH